MMNFLVSFSDVKPIIFAFLGSIGFLVLFMGVAYFTKYISKKIKSKKTDINQIRSEVYRLIYENKRLSLDDLVKYLDLKQDLVEEAIKDLLFEDKIVLNEKMYEIKTSPTIKKIEEQENDKKNDEE